MKGSIYLVLSLLSPILAHTVVHSVWVNGVDQGSWYGVRAPAFNGPPWYPNTTIGSGYQNSPVKDLTSLDTKCNVFGEKRANGVIKVFPGDVVTFEWKHEQRTDTDDVIASSHKGPVVVYISSATGKANSWVKIFEEGEYEAGKWATSPKLIEEKGLHSIQIPKGLRAGKYFLRPELITLHEADAIYSENPKRGVQLYMECIQIEVRGRGRVKLPYNGVEFPGAYSYEDPGIHYNVYWTATGAEPYKIPGPTVWSGAAPSIPNPTLGPRKIVETAQWKSWVRTGTLTWVDTKATPAVTSTATEAYKPKWTGF